MYLSNVKLNAECHTCVNLSKGICKGKETRTPCIAYKDNEEYAQESLKTIRNMLKR